MSGQDTVYYRNGKPQSGSRDLPGEKHFRMVVNGRELLVLVASPHDPLQLATGFLYMQGFISSLDDVVSAGACADARTLSLQIKGELPDRLLPTLTSGCGGGIDFGSVAPARISAVDGAGAAPIRPDQVLSAMAELLRLSEKYAAHGGIHSAALVDGERLLVHSEDLGRHNAVDRLAGECLRRQIFPAGMMLLTSGRVSSEMAVKAARLGVAAIASRTSPTDLARDYCRHAGVGLAGYVRGGAITVFACPELFQL